MSSIRSALGRELPSGLSSVRPKLTAEGRVKDGPNGEPILLNTTSDHIPSLGCDPQVTSIGIPVTQEKLLLHRKMVVHHQRFPGLVNTTKRINPIVA